MASQFLYLLRRFSTGYACIITDCVDKIHLASSNSKIYIVPKNLLMVPKVEVIDKNSIRFIIILQKITFGTFNNSRIEESTPVRV